MKELFNFICNIPNIFVLAYVFAYKDIFSLSRLFNGPEYYTVESQFVDQHGTSEVTETIYDITLEKALLTEPSVMIDYLCYLLDCKMVPSDKVTDRCKIVISSEEGDFEHTVLYFDGFIYQTSYPFQSLEDNKLDKEQLSGILQDFNTDNCEALTGTLTEGLQDATIIIYDIIEYSTDISSIKTRLNTILSKVKDSVDNHIGNSFPQIFRENASLKDLRNNNSSENDIKEKIMKIYRLT
jgi:hypothetical protein